MAKPGFIPGGIGLSFFQDKLGQEENTVVKLAYAYHMEPDANGGILSLGLAANYMGKTLGNEWIYIDEGDAVIPQSAKSGTTVDADLGVMYRVPGSYYAGISTTRIAATDLKDLNISSVRHLYLQAGYEQGLGDGSLRLALPLARQDGSRMRPLSTCTPTSCGTTSSMEAFPSDLEMQSLLCWALNTAPPKTKSLPALSRSFALATATTLPSVN